MDVLQTIPGVGPKIAGVLRELGYKEVGDLKGADPEEMYERLCIRRMVSIDRCVLYVFRCAVYFAETARPAPEKLKWWYWKDT